MLTRCTLFRLLTLSFTLAGTALPASVDRALLEREVSAAITGGGGRFGVGVKDLQTGETWFRAANERFPMQSVFKAPLGAAVLHHIARGRLRLDDPVVVQREDLAMQWSPLAREFTGERRTYTVRDLLERAVGASDNTAADVLMRLIGGPHVVQEFLQAHGISDLRVDRYEREFQPELLGLPPFKHGERIDEAAYQAAAEALPRAARQAALDAYLADPRDTATPHAALAFLEQLDAGTLLNAEHTALLLDIMTRSPSGPNRLKAGLPAGSSFAHKTGMSGEPLGIAAATNDIGIVRLPDGRKFLLASFQAGSPRPEKERDAAHARIARAAVTALAQP
ncbi:MAG TPA: class A beta-lactamase [Opitutaceae bacterium]